MIFAATQPLNSMSNPDMTTALPALSSFSSMTYFSGGVCTNSITAEASSYKRGGGTTKNLLIHQLPRDFTPGPYSVICGRGRRALESVGNRRLTVLAQLHIPEYSKATRKDDKSKVVTKVVEMVQQACDVPQHAFVRYQNGQWWQVEPLNAREKVGTVLRDLLSSKYRSSTKSKLARRKKRREQKQPTDEAEDVSTAKRDSDKAIDTMIQQKRFSFTGVMPTIATSFFSLEEQHQEQVQTNGELDLHTVSDDGVSVLSEEEMENLFP